MNNEKRGQSKTAPFSVYPEAVSLIIGGIIFLSAVVIPMKITGYGYLPPDDALRHSAKALSGKEWSEILVLDRDIKMDNHPGWHAVLAGIHKAARLDADGLTVFAVVFLFALFYFTAAGFLEYKEAWPLAVLIVVIMNPMFLRRLALGRPFILTVTALTVLCLLWPKFKEKKFPFFAFILFAALIAASTWIHGSWYLFILPVLSFYIARELKVAFMMTAAAAAGILTGAALTGHPVLFLKESLYHAFGAFGNCQLQRMLVSEFQPSSGDPLAALLVAGMIAWRGMRKDERLQLGKDPVFILAFLGWCLGFYAKRFWMDWGLPALIVWMANEIQAVLRLKLGSQPYKRITLAILVAVISYTAFTNDAGGRWTNNLTTEYLTMDDPEQAPWLPGPGGILYSDDMGIFYETFFKNPRAPWRYILGFEAGMMPREDLAVFRRIQWNYGDVRAFEPWVRKMRPQDRLILRRDPNNPPDIKGLEWHYAATGIWIGRLPE